MSSEKNSENNHSFKITGIFDNSLILKSQENFFSPKGSSFHDTDDSLKIINIHRSKKNKYEDKDENEDKENKTEEKANNKKNLTNRYNKLIIYLLTLNASFSYLFIGVNMAVTDTLHETFIKLFNWNNSDARYYISLLNSVIPLGGLIGALILSPIILKRGRRLSLLIANLIGLIGTGIMNILIVEVMILGRFLCGIVIGMYMSCLGIYVKEYVPYDIIGFCGSIYELNYSIGIFLAYLLGLNLPNPDYDEENNWWRFMLSCPLIFLMLSNLFFLTFFKHETPFFSYVYKGDIEETKITLSEIYYDQNDIENILKDYADHSQNQKSDITLWDIFSKKYRYRFFIVLCLQITQQACGVDAFIMYSDVLFLESISDKHNATLLTNLVGIFIIISGIITLFLIEKLGRKVLLIMGQLILTICLVLLSYFYFIEYPGPTIYLIIIYMFVNALTLSPMSAIYTADVLPEVGIGICVGINNIFSFMVTESFMHIKHSSIGLKGLMLMFAAFVFLNLLVTIFCLKETKDLSSDKIDQMYSPKKIEPLIDTNQSSN